MRRFANVPFTIVVLALQACGGQAFSPSFREYEEPEFSRVVSALNAAPARQERAIVVGVAEGPDRIVAWDPAAGRLLWSVPTAVRSAPILAGAHVVTAEATRVVARDLATGHEAFVVDDEEGSARLVGADGDGEYTAISLATGEASAVRGLLVVARGNEIVWTRELDQPAGTPAVAASMVIVPWATQRLSIIDAATGNERARLRMASDVVGHAFVTETGVYVGQHGVFRITPTIEGGERQGAAYYQPRERRMPGQPPLLRDGYAPVPPPTSAMQRVRLAWRPTGQGEQVSVQDNNLYLLFYRYVFALDSESDSLRWIYQHPTDIVGASVQAGGIFVTAEDGKLAFLNAENGAKQFETDTRIPFRAASLRLAGFQRPSANAGDVEPLQARLMAAASLSDPRLAAGRAFVIQHLAKFDDAEVTGNLVTLCSDRSAPDLVRDSACQAVGERTKGEEHIRAALARRASFLEGSAAPPVAALARAAARMRINDAAPLLVQHLQDPATPSSELEGIFVALKELNARASGPTVLGFLRLYHADTGDDALASALGAAAETTAALAPSGADATLSAIANDALTPAPLQARARSALASLSAPQTPTE